MARTALKCPCGWTVFIPRSQIEKDLSCPMCGRDVVKPPVAVEEVPERKSVDLAFLGVAVALTLVMVVVACLTIFGGSDKREGRIVTVVQAPSAPPASVVDPAPRKSATPVLTTSNRTELPRTLPVLEPPRLTHVEGMVRSINAAGLAAEYARFTGDAPRHDLLLTRMRVLREFAETDVASLREEGVTVQLPDHLMPNDRLVVLKGINLAAMKADKAALAIRALVETLAPDASVPVTIERQGVRRQLTLSFSEFPSDVRVSICEARPQASIIPAATAETTPAAPATTPAPAPASAALAKRVEQMLKEAPDYYVSMISIEDFERVQKILVEGPAGADDEAYVNRICEYVYYWWRLESNAIGHALKHAAQDIARPSQRDVVRFADGTRRVGTVLDETDDSVTIEFVASKVRGSRTFPRSEIAKVERGAGPGPQFPSRLRQCGSDLVLLAELMAWCRQNHLGREADWIALKLLQADPNHAAARTTLGFKRNPRGIWEY